MIPSGLRSAMAANDELVLHEMALVAGATSADLARLTRRGLLVRVRRGVYTTAEHWHSLAPGPARELLRARAASMVMLHAHVFSHDSAAHALGLAFLQPRDPFVHITRPGVDGSRHDHGVRHHSARYEPRQVLTLGALRVLDPARTAVDLARQHGLHTGVTACDSALRGGTTRRELWEAVRPMARWRGVRAAREAIDLADPGAENPAESLARLLVVETGFGRPRTQFPVRVDGRVVWCDLLLGRQVIEFDGRVKYLPESRGGVATRDPGEVVWAERHRERALLRAGLGVSRLVWDDLLPQNWERSRRRVAGEIDETFRLRGAATPAHLLEEARRWEAERRRRIFGTSPYLRK